MTDFLRLPAFAQGDSFNVVVESPRGAGVKLKYDSELGAMSVSRPLAIGLAFPYDWGFIPSTRAMDGDPVDAIVLWDVASFPGVVIPCAAAGIVKVEQNRGQGSAGRIRNDRVIGVPVEARRDTRGALGGPDAERIRREVANFLVAMTALEGKDIAILGWDGPAAAVAHIRESLRQG